MAQCTCQHDPVDSPRRGTSNYVNHDSQVDRSTDVAQKVEIDPFGIKFGVGGIADICECDARALLPVGNGMKSARSPGELQNLLGDPMHIDSERGTAKANKRYAEFFFAQTLFRS